jgi:hypothetical protein
VVFRSWTTAEIETFIIEVSTTRTNIAIASRRASLVEFFASLVLTASGFVDMVNPFL